MLICALLDSAHASDAAALPVGPDGTADTGGGVTGGVVAQKPVEPVLAGDIRTRLQLTVYASHFSREEVRAMIAFYRTPVGQKLIAETPALTADAMNVGQIWGRELATRVVQKMQAASPPSEP